MKKEILKVLSIVVMLGFVVVGCSDNNASARGAFFGKPAKNVVSDKTLNRTLMKVEKLTCGSCLTAISQKLAAFDGLAGIGADLGRGLVAVDHAKALESNKIAEAITSIGYPATIISVTEIDSSKSFSSASTLKSQQYGGGCCGSSGYSNSITNESEGGSNFSSQENNYSTGCPYSGSVRSRGCYANSSSWKELLERFSEK